ncbi:hypothetical protein [Bradyrhizobium sp. CCBAU 11430]|uniref:hypothetical protein n=1 Tax=Bradyrhizobium sp. CCBAU 11430 TaxID=1630881 RepID=UPI002305540E|nr:hypothetical protein [Bradyrhizobium sp. CCBAU 11430]
MMADRRPLFELHILPMFRALDAIHMLRLPPAKRVDLSSYDDLKNKHQDVLDFLNAASPMPPKSHGGPWPKEWIDLFTRWKTTGFGRLIKPAGSNFDLALTGPDRFTLSCDVLLPDGSASAWFSIIQATADAQVYEIVLEQPDGTPPAPTTITIEERLRGPLTTNEVVVLDSAGRHALGIPTS